MVFHGACCHDPRMVGRAVITYFILVAYDEAAAGTDGAVLC
jgi:hypothetical protein